MNAITSLIEQLQIGYSLNSIYSLSTPVFGDALWHIGNYESGKHYLFVWRSHEDWQRIPDLRSPE